MSKKKADAVLEVLPPHSEVTIDKLDIRGTINAVMIEGTPEYPVVLYKVSLPSGNSINKEIFYEDQVVATDAKKIKVGFA